MSSMTEPKWKRFEALVAQVQKAFSPDAKITLNERIMGRWSDTLREVDIVVRQQVGQFGILIILDCKDHKRPVDVKHIEEFIGLVGDVSANKGAMVSASGFTETAKTRAVNSGVDLYRLVDAEAHDWQTYVSIPVVCDFRSLGMCRFKIKASEPTLQWLSRQDIKLLPLYNTNRVQLGTALSLLRAKWNKGEISSEPGSHTDVRLVEKALFVCVDDRQYEEVEISSDFNVIKKLYFGQLPLTSVKGFKDEVAGGLVLPGQSEIVTDRIDFVEVERTWLKILSEDSLAVKPVMTVIAMDHYPSSPQISK